MLSREGALLTAWAIVAAIAIGLQLGGYPLLDADEGRNGEVGREMADTNDYVMPRYDGLPYLDKPVVYFAAEAAVMELTGPTEFAARVPAWLFTIATALFVAWFAAREGIDPALAAIIFLSTPLTIAFARTVIFDSALTFFITVALIAFYYACDDKRWTALAWAAMAFGVITKGPVALAVPLLVAVPYAIWRRRWRALVSAAGLILFVIIIAPWVWAISRAVPDFLHYVLVTETAQRLTTGALKRTGPPWYFVPYLIGGAFPWIFSIWDRSRPAEAGPHTWLLRYLMLWIVIPFIFFSLSQSKRPQYILPLMPAIALLVARRAHPGRAMAIATVLLGALLLAAVPFVHLPYGMQAAVVIGILALVAGAVAFFVPGRFAWIALSIPMLSVPLVANSTMNALAMRRSAHGLMSQIRPYLGPDSEVIGLEAFTGSMAFYLQRPVIIVTPDGEELTSNYIIRHYPRFAADARSTIRPMTWLTNAFDHSRHRLFIVRINDRRNRAVLEQHGARLVAGDAHFAAYTMPR